ncbi:MAG: NUDIX hydrolase [Lachnospiraceae bacterium]|nr:NUDIX hydrolase [Lachnospiraceae bacterium]
MKGEKTLSTKEIFTGRIIKVHVDDVELENGKKGYREVVDHPGGVCVAAVTACKELLFVRQFRYPYHEVCLELPAGKLEPGEDPADAIKRELKEETGCTGKNWQFMGNLYPSPGYCGEIIRLWMCEVDTESSEQDLDEDEFVECERISIEKAMDMVMKGEIPDAKTQVLIMKAAKLYI